MTRQALKVTVKGIVQGVGFRPFVYLTARRLGLKGEVYNTSGDVTIRLEGNAGCIRAFLKELRAGPPAGSTIESVETTGADWNGYSDFAITESQARADEYQLISPDLAVCPDCLKELFDPSNRRFRYPFINCTHCGPRFTIIEDIPYDRPLTTMCDFEMCPDCRREYTNPLDRRFHAQPDACPVCGPHLRLTDARGSLVVAPDVITRTVELLRDGQIVAIKGLGGFLLACNAGSETAVSLLRKRKRRPSKPLAVMLPDLEAVRHYCAVEQSEADVLSSKAAPIVLLALNNRHNLAPSVAPGLNRLGVMLPYTPLHHILLRESGLPLVMTSGNLSEEPIAKDDSEALQRLRGIADYFLMHNRAIFSRCDDSVVTLEDGVTRMVRRARGYAPDPVRLKYHSESILACGPELKNTFCLTRDEYAFVSQHIGDMENLETLEHFEKTLRLYQKLFRIRPRLLACDLHPDYLTTRWALQEARRLDVPLTQVQHHHAHIAACMAENGVTGPVIGVALDGTGYGLDGQIWGGEFMVADFRGFQRQAHFEYLPLPGGQLAIRKPYRLAIGYLFQLLGEAALQPDLPGLRGIAETEIEIIKTQVQRHLNTPRTSSCGRLFDAVSALLGIGTDPAGQVDYEGQAAVELEAAAEGYPGSPDYPYRFEQQAETRVIKLDVLLAAILEDIRRGTPRGEISARFHNTVLSIMMEIVNRLADENGIRQVALSGGVFQNRRISLGAQNRLRAAGLEPLLHRRLPVNDGCISLGQAAVAHFNPGS